MQPTAKPVDASRSIADFLDATGGKTPAPGGGAVAALAGALAAAIGEMVLQYSAGRKKNSPADDAALADLIAEMRRARQLLLGLMVEDQGAFEALSAARKNAKERGDGDATFAAALLACIRIPQSIGAAASAMLDLCQRALPLANPYLLSDLAVCCELAMATIRCAGWNVRANLADISDPAERERLAAATDVALARGAKRVRPLIDSIWQRYAEAMQK